MRSASSGDGIDISRVSSNRPAPVQLLSQMPAMLNRMISQPSPRRGRINRAPISTSNKKGTGGNSSAVMMGFQVSMPIKANKPFMRCLPPQSLV